VAAINSFKNSSCSFLGITRHRIWNLDRIANRLDHLLDRGVAIRIAETAITLEPGWCDDAGCEGGAEWTRLYNQDLDTEGLDLVVKRFAGCFNCELACGIR